MAIIGRASKIYKMSISSVVVMRGSTNRRRCAQERPRRKWLLPADAKMQSACTVARLRAAGATCVQLPATRQTELKRRGGRSGVAESGSETTTDSEQMRTRRTTCELYDQSLLHVLDPGALAVWLNVATPSLCAFAIRLAPCEQHKTADASPSTSKKIPRKKRTNRVPSPALPTSLWPALLVEYLFLYYTEVIKDAGEQGAKRCKCIIEIRRKNARKICESSQSHNRNQKIKATQGPRHAAHPGSPPHPSLLWA